MMLEVIQLLKNSETLNALIGTSNIYPTQTYFMGDCIIYNFHTIYEDRKIQKCRMEITIITTTIAKSLEVENEIKSILLTLGDKPLNNKTLQVGLNGGGTLYDSSREKHHRIIYLDIINRSEI